MLNFLTRRLFSRRAQLAAGAACFAITLGGCIASGSSKTYSSGRYIGDQTIARVEPGKTDKQWVMAVFGEPTSRTPLSTGVEIWKWEYTKVTTSSGSVLFIVSGKNRDETIRNVYIEFESDVVTQIWRD